MLSGAAGVAEASLEECVGEQTVKPPVAIDLFAGGGGLTEGLRMAGFNVVLACDADPRVQETHEYNHEDTAFLCTPVEHLDKATLGQALLSCPDAQLEDLDLIAGGPPCQGFSSIGPRQPDDERNALVLTFASVVATIKPKAFIMENVLGLLSTKTAGGRIVDQAIRLLTTAGYVVTQPVKALSAADYGVPQFRRRVFVMGVRADIATDLPDGKLHYPSATHAGGAVPPDPLLLGGLPAHLALEEAISDLPAVTKSVGEVLAYPKRRKLSEYQKLMRRGATEVYNHHTKGAERLRRARIKALQPGDNATMLHGKLQAGGLDGKYRRLRYDQPAPTITAHIGKDLSDFIHPKRNRWISAREAARIQSFPDVYQFFGSQALQLRTIGNAVPPLLAGWVAYAVGKQLGMSVHAPDQQVDDGT